MPDDTAPVSTAALAAVDEVEREARRRTRDIQIAISRRLIRERLDMLSRAGISGEIIREAMRDIPGYRPKGAGLSS